MNPLAESSPRAAELRVAGLAPLSTCDWPGELVATVFCQGCAWNCPYCHNPHLRPASGSAPIPWAEVSGFLERRRRLLDAVVFSGGEPTLQPALIEAMREVRRLGFRIGLHTAGMAPEMLARSLPIVDWVGLDIKGPAGAYARITGVASSGAQAFASLDALLRRGISLEVRTTLYPGLLSLADMFELRGLLLARGVTRFAVQRFRSAGVDPRDRKRLPQQVPFDLPADFGSAFDSFIVR